MAERPENEAPREKRSLGDYFEKVWGQALEDSVQRALSRLKIPRREKILEFTSRLDRIERRISALEAERGQ
jgi:polyhydroxyalkanoate synthesis regulator phasin